MKNFLKKASHVVQLVLMAPVKLPGKALNIIRYVALGLGILDQVWKEEEKGGEEEDDEQP